jgi:hypothetical protein
MLLRILGVYECSEVMDEMFCEEWIGCRYSPEENNLLFLEQPPLSTSDLREQVKISEQSTSSRARCQTYLCSLASLVDLKILRDKGETEQSKQLHGILGIYKGKQIRIYTTRLLQFETYVALLDNSNLLSRADTKLKLSKLVYFVES